MPLFGSVRAIATPDDIKTVDWAVNGCEIPYGKAISFLVDRSVESYGDWVQLTPEPVDGPLFQDSERVVFNMVSDVWYRIRAILSSDDDPDTVVDSPPTQLQGFLTDRAYAIGKTMTRQFYTRMKKGGGQQGFLKKRRIWGTPCPRCLDFDNETVVNAHCPVCYGTGFVGGYHEGVEFWLLPKTVQGRTRETNETGTWHEHGFDAECVAYPWLDSEDVWMDSRTGERFIVKSISNVLEIERKPVVLQIRLDKLTATDVAQSLPVVEAQESPYSESGSGEVAESFEVEDMDECILPVSEKTPKKDSDVVKSDEASEDRGWRRGIDMGGDF